MKLFFPNQKRQQIALAKNQDGARGDDLPNQHKTGTLDCLYLLNFQGGTCGGDFQIPESTAIQDFLPADFHSWR